MRPDKLLSKAVFMRVKGKPEALDQHRCEKSLIEKQVPSEKAEGSAT